MEKIINILCNDIEIEVSFCDECCKNCRFERGSYCSLFNQEIRVSYGFFSGKNKYRCQNCVERFRY